jgi:hypothetical protein
VTALVGAAALLLLAAGALKVADPGPTAAALTARRKAAVSPAVVRAGGVAEAALGAATLVVGGPVLAALVAVAYAAYTLWVGAALRQGAPCGCFGEPDTPARPAQLVVDAGFAVAAAVGAAVGAGPLVGSSPPVVLAAVAVAVAGYLVLARQGAGGRRRATR